MWRIFSESRRVEELVGEVRDLKSRLDGLEVDWETLHERVLTNLRRMRQIHAKLEEVETNHNEAAVAKPGEAMASPGGGRLLNPRQQQIQQMILRRRAGG